MITDYYIIATLIYLTCMGVVYWIWRRRDIDRREFLLLFLVGLLMVWASPILMKRLGPTTLVLIYTLIPLTAAIISTRMGNVEKPDQNDKIADIKAPVTSGTISPMKPSSELPVSDIQLPINKTESNYGVRRRFNLGRLIRLHPVSNTGEPTSLAADTELAAEVSVVYEPIKDSQLKIEDTEAVKESADVIETTASKVADEVVEAAVDPINESLPEAEEEETAHELVKMTTSNALEDEITETISESLEESLPSIENMATANEVLDEIESTASEMASDVVEETIELAEENPPVTETIETADADDVFESVVSEMTDEVTEEAIEPIVESTSESELTDMTNKPIDGMESMVPDSGVVDDVSEQVKESTLVIENTEADEETTDMTETDAYEIDEKFAEEPIEPLEKSLLEAVDTGTADKTIEITDNSIIINDTPDNIGEETPGDLADEHPDSENQEVMKAEEDTAELTAKDSTTLLNGVESEMPVDTEINNSRDEMQYKVEIINEDEFINKPEEDDEAAVEPLDNTEKTYNDIDNTLAIAHHQELDNISEKVETELQPESVGEQTIDNTKIGQQSDDIEREIRHNIAEGNLPSDTENEFSQDIEEGIMPVLSEQKQVKSARQRMLEEKVNRSLDAGFDAKFAGNWTEAISRFVEAFKITDDTSLKGMLVRDIVGMYLEMADYQQAETTYQNYLNNELAEDERKEIQREIGRLRLMAQELTNRGMPLMPYRKVPRLLQIKVDDLLNRSDISKQVEGSKKRK